MDFVDFVIDETGEKPKTTRKLGSSIAAVCKAYKRHEAMRQKKEKKKNCASSSDWGLEEFEKDMGWSNSEKKHAKNLGNVDKLLQQVQEQSLSEIMKKVVDPNNLETKDLELIGMSDKALRKRRKLERAKTTGNGWFNMKCPEMTDEVKHDLEIIQMRSALDPKRFFKKNDTEELPKYFEIGKVKDSPMDFYSSRLTKKERKRTIVDELMADADFAKYNKRKYKEIIEEKKKTHYKAHKKMKKLKGRKK